MSVLTDAEKTIREFANEIKKRKCFDYGFCSWWPESKYYVEYSHLIDIAERLKKYRRRKG